MSTVKIQNTFVNLFCSSDEYLPYIRHFKTYLFFYSLAVEKRRNSKNVSENFYKMQKYIYLWTDSFNFSGEIFELFSFLASWNVSERLPWPGFKEKKIKNNHICPKNKNPFYWFSTISESPWLPNSAARPRYMLFSVFNLVALLEWVN